MSMLKSNLDGTMAAAFSIGKRGPTIRQGLGDPNASGQEGVNGDLYVKTGASPSLYQFRTDRWISMDTAPVGATSFRRAFALADLTNGLLTLAHGLNDDFPTVTVYDGLRRTIIPDEILSHDANTITLDLTAYGNIAGNWTAIVRK